MLNLMGQNLNCTQCIQAKKKCYFSGTETVSSSLGLKYSLAASDPLPPPPTPHPPPKKNLTSLNGPL